MRDRKPRPMRLALPSPIRLGMARKTPRARAKLMARRFQRGKSSIGSVVRGFGAGRADVAQHRLDDAMALSAGEFDLDLALLDLGHLADMAAAGDDLVALLHRVDLGAQPLHCL